MNTFAKNILGLVILITQFSIAQDRCNVSGKVTSNFDELEGIYVINRNSEKTTFTKRGGYFTIQAAVNDTLVISSVQFIAKEIIVQENNFGSDLLLVPLQPMHRELSEVIITDYSHINAVSLGLVPANQKKYTPAERKLATASKFKMNPLGIDPIINAFSGRTAILKKAVDTEKKETLIDKLSYLYSEDDIIAKLKIPVEYVNGFIYYVVENKYFAKAIDEKNHEMAKFMITGLAEKYLSLLENDK